MMTRIHSTPRRTWATAVLLAVALAACSDATGPLPREGAPDELKFTFSSFGSGVTIVELDDEGVAVTRIPWGYVTGMPIVPVRVVPTAAAWAEFWEAAEQAGLRRWRSEYLAEGVVDGAGWGLRIVTDDAVIDSHGSNAYPDRRGREHEMEMTDDFRAFLEAIGTLAGQDF
ncbi:MAG TPA: hypothetical protein VFT45_15985 [Longimicrobium sp.]|nr:hypothetical protein [Longimicrobium sp.]